MTAADAYDVAIVGGGHNGLVTAAYLARAGLRVIVLERRATLGGCATTDEIRPGFRVPTAAALCGLLRPEVVRDLQLVRHGLQLLPFDPEVVAFGEDGRTLRLWRDVSRTQSEIAGFSMKDAAAYAGFRSFLTALAGTMDPLLLRTPPEIPSPAISDELFLLRRAWGLKRLGKETLHQAARVPTMSLHAFLGEWFETDLLKATLAVDALTGMSRGPWSPGTAFGLLHHYLPYALGGSWSFVRGGMGRLTDALAEAAREAGAVLRTNADVSRILVRDGRAAGVEVAPGVAIPARAVASSADPKRTFLRLVPPEELDLGFLHAVRSLQAEGALAKVNLALDGLPAADGGVPPRFRIAPSLEYLERAYDDAKYGRLSKEPFLDVSVPSLVDPEVAPAGKHVMSVLVQYAPYRLRRGRWEDAKADLLEKVLDRLEERLPGLKKLVRAKEILSPADLENRFGLTGGHIHHGEMGLNQQYVLRPVPGWARYRMPIEGLYLCGSGAHPGGGITGAPGYNAAREIMRDLRGRGA